MKSMNILKSIPLFFFIICILSIFRQYERNKKICGCQTIIVKRFYFTFFCFFFFLSFLKGHTSKARNEIFKSGIIDFSYMSIRLSLFFPMKNLATERAQNLNMENKFSFVNFGDEKFPFQNSLSHFFSLFFYAF